MRKTSEIYTLSHTSWNCKYHLVFAPKYRKKFSMNKEPLDLRWQIDELKRSQGLNEATIDYICNFITKSAKLWKDIDFGTK